MVLTSFCIIVLVGRWFMGAGKLERNAVQACSRTNLAQARRRGVVERAKFQSGNSLPFQGWDTRTASSLVRGPPPFQPLLFLAPLLLLRLPSRAFPPVLLSFVRVWYCTHGHFRSFSTSSPSPRLADFPNSIKVPHLNR